jgi:excisionase family DNA binding protein
MGKHSSNGWVAKMAKKSDDSQRANQKSGNATLTTSELITSGEAAKLLNVHIDTIRRWDKEGKLVAVRTGNQNWRRYRRSDILALFSDKVEKVADNESGLRRFNSVQMLEKMAYLLQIVGGKLNSEETFQRLVAELVPTLGCSVVSIRYLDNSGQNLHLWLGVDTRGKLNIETYRKLPVPVAAAAFLAEAIVAQRPVCSSDIENDSRFDPRFVEGSGVKAIIAAPMRDSGGQLLSLLLLAWTDRPHDFRAEEVVFIEAIARQSALALENSRLYVELNNRRRRIETIFNTINDALVAYDKDMRITRLNNLARKLLYGEKLSGKITGMHTDSLAQIFTTRRIDGQPLTPEENPVYRAVKLGETVSNYQLIISNHVGKDKLLSANVAPLLNENGEPSGAIAAFRVISPDEPD